jgi:cation diffusion facilitator CzcD-associated flavoprotein CzcO
MGTSSRRGTGASTPTTSWLPPARTSLRGFRRSPRASIRASCSCTHDYRGPFQLKEGGVLVVGVGNSGVEIAFEVVRTHRTWLSGQPSAQIPVRHGPAAARFVFPVVRFMGHHVLTRGTPIGRKLGPKLESGPLPSSASSKDLASAGVEQVARTAGVRDGLPVLEDGRVIEASNVIWSNTTSNGSTSRSSTSTALPFTDAASWRASRVCTSWAWSSSTPCPRTSSRI